MQVAFLSGSGFEAFKVQSQVFQIFQHMQIIGVMKEPIYAGSDFGTHIFQILKVFERVLREVHEIAHRCGQGLGRRLPNITDTQSEDQPVQRLLPGSLHGSPQVSDALFSVALQRLYLVIGQPVDTGNIFKESELIELPDVRIAETTDIHSVLAGEMNDPLDHLGRAVDIDAAPYGLSFGLFELIPAYRAMRREHDGRFLS